MDRNAHGASLAACQQNVTGPIRPVVAIHIACEIARLVLGAHAKESSLGKKVTHVSITPENVFIGYDGNVEVLGIPGMQRLQASPPNPAYYAPEQVSGSSTRSAYRGVRARRRDLGALRGHDALRPRHSRRDAHGDQRRPRSVRLRFRTPRYRSPSPTRSSPPCGSTSPRVTNRSTRSPRRSSTLARRAASTPRRTRWTSPPGSPSASRVPALRPRAPRPRRRCRRSTRPRRRCRRSTRRRGARLRTPRPRCSLRPNGEPARPGCPTSRSRHRRAFPSSPLLRPRTAEAPGIEAASCCRAIGRAAARRPDREHGRRQVPHVRRRRRRRRLRHGDRAQRRDHLVRERDELARAGRHAGRGRRAARPGLELAAPSRMTREPRPPVSPATPTSPASA